METQINTETLQKKIKLDFKDSKYATGRRKKSIAKVWLKKGSGIIHVNGKKMVDYFKKANLQIAIFRPLTISKRETEYDVRCSVKGGGLTGQAGAIVHGLSRAIVLYEPDLKPTLKNLMPDPNIISDMKKAVERVYQGIIDKKIQYLDMDIENIEKGNFDHFMLKEIFEQPSAIINAVRGRIDYKNNKGF